MSEWLNRAKPLRYIGALLAVIGFTGFVYGWGTAQSLVLHYPTGPIAEIVQPLPATLIDMYVFGIATGAGAAAYIMFSLMKEKKQA